MTGRMGQIRWKYSIQTKQMLVFVLVVVVNMLLIYTLQSKAIDIATEATYERMNANTDYYMNTLENEISYVHELQMDFFNDRRLPFLISPEISLSAYEQREYLLSIWERLKTITGVSNLVSDGTLLLPKSGYKITQSGVTRMISTDYDTVQDYIAYAGDGLSYVESKLFLLEMGVPHIRADSSPNHVLIITFSPEMIRRSMASLNTSEGSGAFLYWETENLLLENSRDQPIAQDIYASLQKDKDGAFTNIQRVMVGGEWYLIFIGRNSGPELFVQYVKEEPIMRSIYQFRTQMLLVNGFAAVLFFLFAAYTRRLIHKPIETLLGAFSEVKTGNWSKRIYHANEDEFGYLFEGFNDMVENTKHLIDEVYIQKNLSQRAHLKHLQAQINPHFLYNSFFALSRRVKRHDFEAAQELTEHLGNYFRFLTRDASDSVSLKQEVEHAKSYAGIQGSRFISRLTIQFGELPECCEALLVPRLILQPLLENAFEHGLQTTIKGGLLEISFAKEGPTLFIHVQDNGTGITDAEIEHMQKMLDEADDGEITGIRNIHRRLSIFFKGYAGLRIARSSLGGVRVTVFIESEGDFA